MYETLNKINGAVDVKKMDLQELNALAEDIREALFNRLTKIGGHFGPNFGMVEAEIALHYVFNSPLDKIVFDVSHQSYPQKKAIYVTNILMTIRVIQIRRKANMTSSI